jgi:hypothetical protein
MTHHLNQRVVRGALSAMAPSDPVIEVQTAIVKRTKVGYAEFQQSSPPEWNVYKSYVNTFYEVWDAWSFASPPATDSSETYTMLYTYQKATTDPNNYTLTGPLQELGCTAISAPESLTYAGTAIYYHARDYENGGPGSVTDRADQDANGQRARKHSWSNSEYPPNGWNDCYGWREERLEDEYTTPELIGRLFSDLTAAPYSGWFQGAATASFHLTSYKKCGTASKFKSRISFSTQEGKILH